MTKPRPNRTANKSHRKTRRSARVSALRTVQPFLPHSRTVQLCYVQRKGISETTVATGTTHTWSLNNLYDPDVTGIGTQPINFDQLCALYTLFRVTAVDYLFEVVDVIATGGSTVSVGIVPSWNNALPSDVTSWLGQPFVQSRYLTVIGNRIACDFRGHITPWHLLQVPKRQYMDSPDYTCTASGGPVRNVYITAFAIGSGAAASISISVRLIYTVQCMIPVLNALS